MFKGRFTLFAPLLLCLLASQAIAQGPTPAQINMFQNLPASQQQALADQFGVDLSQAQAQATSSESPSQLEEA
ncbi:hypothetical protein, partial [Streptomyces scabiei]|uniref:hypothetical protein n=1 Tax=Streptomyces scabiei TaxID=1930 RepID=UPI0038F63A4D